MNWPLVAVVGKPNVGKSTLANRLAERRASIVSPASGLTRDRLERTIVWGTATFVIIDTGGAAPSAVKGRGNDLGIRVAGKALEAAAEADVIVFVVDAEGGLTSEDSFLAEMLKKLSPPVIVAANKVDDASGEGEAAQAWSLGLGEPIPVSALHGRRTEDLLDRIVEFLPAKQPEEGEERATASISIVGRPNVGKSSIFNRLAGTERAIVHDQPGTTRDSVDTIVETGDRRYRFVDTAGLRRRAKTSGIDIYGAARTKEAIRSSDVVMIVLDASEGATSQDQRIAEHVADAGVGVLVVANKWDLIVGPEEAERFARSLSDRMGFVAFAPVVRASALSGRGVGSLIDQIERVRRSRHQRVPTGQLNEVLQRAQQKTPAPRIRGRNVKLLYATQAETAPPTFVLFMTGKPPPSWLRHIEHSLRDRFGFFGNPIRLVVRERRSGDLPAARRSG